LASADLISSYSDKCDNSSVQQAAGAGYIISGHCVKFSFVFFV